MTEKDLQFVISVLKSEVPSGEPDWYAVMGFLFCHRVAGLFYNRAGRLGLELPKKAEKILADVFLRQKRKVLFLREAIGAITDKLAETNTPYMLLKGSVLSHLSDAQKRIYEDGERLSDDIDLLVRPTEIAAVSRILHSLGFEQGTYILESDAIRPFSRTEIVKRRINRGEVAPFVKRTGDGEFPFVEADINFSLGNTPSEGMELLDAMVSSATTVREKVTMRVAGPELFFLHLIMHQYKESCLLFMTKRNKDLDLYKLADIYYLLKTGVVDKQRLNEYIGTYRLAQPAGVVLGQVGEIFADAEIMALAKTFVCETPAVVDYDNKKTYVWRATLTERLCTLATESFLEEIPQ